MSQLSPRDIRSILDLPSLPPPALVATPEFAEIYEAMVAHFQSLNPAYSLWVESDPVAIVLQVMAYRELLWRHQLNWTAMQTLLAFAEGANLDHRAAFYGVTRLDGEGDNRLRVRTVAKIRGWACAGAEDHYRYWALTASTGLADVAVWSPNYPNGFNMGGKVVVSLLGATDNGVVSVETLRAVEAVLLRPDVRPMTAQVTVEPAGYVQTDITAVVVLEADTPYDVFTGAKAALVKSLREARKLGQDLTQSWLSTQLHVKGVHSVRVLEPVEDIAVDRSQFVLPRLVNIVFGGFASTTTAEAMSDTAMVLRTAFNFYLRYAVSVARSQRGILADLTREPLPGVIEPTLRGFAEFLGINQHIDPVTRQMLPSDEVALLIFGHLSPQYPANLRDGAPIS